MSRLELWMVTIILVAVSAAISLAVFAFSTQLLPIRFFFTPLVVPFFYEWLQKMKEGEGPYTTQPAPRAFYRKHMET